MPEHNSISTENNLPPLPDPPEVSGITLEENREPITFPSASDHSLSPGNVRFLVAASLPFPLTISIDQTVYAENLGFGTVSVYAPISDGFHEITITYSLGPKILLLKELMPFQSEEDVTLVILDSETLGISVSLVSDNACRNLSQTMGCFRAANMAFSQSVFDLLLPTGESVFRDISYNSVTAYKLTEPGNWTFQVSSLTCSESYKEIPVIAASALSASCTWIFPALRFQTSIQPGASYTAYLIGNQWSDHPLQALVVQDGISPSQLS